MSEPFLYRARRTCSSTQMGAGVSGAPAQTTTRSCRWSAAEEERFDAVLTGGLPKLEEVLDRAAASGGPVSGDEAFKLYDTFGLPLDFIEDLDERAQAGVRPRRRSMRAMESQREKARAEERVRRQEDEEFTFGDPSGADRLRVAGDTFEGYTDTAVKDAHGAGAVRRGSGSRSTELRGRIRPASSALDVTPFYLESGGQVSDVGTLQNEAGTVLARVEGVLRLGPGWPRAHRVQVEGAPLRRRAGRRHRRRRRREARRDAPESHGDAPAPRGAPPDARHAREAGRLARGAGPPALRLHALRGRHAGRARRRSSEIVNAQICATPPCTTEVRSTEEAIAGRRDGALRREVRRPACGS